MTKFRPTIAFALAVLFCLASLTFAEERMLTPEQMEKLAQDGELTEETETQRPAKLPDLTKGDLVGEKRKSDTWHLGPTGIIGYMVGGYQGDQIQVESTLKGSPAEGKLQWGDVILGVSGKKFVAGQHLGYTFGNAIIEAEQEETKGVLKLLIWRDRNFVNRNSAKDVAGVDIEKLLGKAAADDSLYDWKPEAERKKEVKRANFEEFPIDGYYAEVELKLRVLPAYSDTSPYDCLKAAQIREDAWKVLVEQFQSGRVRGGRSGTVAALALVASGKPEHRRIVRDWVRSNACKAWHPSVEGSIDMMKPRGYFSWYMSFTGLDCAIYYDATGDDFVLPALREYAIKTAMGQAGGGSWGHTFAWPTFNGGQLHGMNPGYGALNAAGNRCFFLVALAQQLGIEHPELDLAVKRGQRFFGSYVDKGAIPYGFHGAAATDDSNGKNTGVAFALKLLGDKHGAKYFAQMSTHASFTRRGGHGDDYFWHYSPWAATLCGREGTIVTMRNMRWWHTLCRRYDGGFVIHSPTGCKALRDPTATYALHYSAPLKQTIITGKDVDPSYEWTEREMEQLLTSALPQLNDTSLIQRAGTPWRERTTDELFKQLDFFKPKARGQYATELGKRYQAGEKEIVPRLANLLESDQPRLRDSACRGLAACGGDATLQYLSKVARLLNDPQEFVRMQAVRTMSRASNSPDTQLALLKATIDEDEFVDMSLPPNSVRGLTQMALFGGKTKLAKSPFEAGFDEEMVQAALEKLVDLDPMAPRAFLPSRTGVWSRDTVVRLAGPITFVAEDKQINDQMFGGGRHLAGRALLSRFGYREYIEASAGPLLKNAALPRDIRPQVGFKISMVDPEVIQKHPAACHELLEPLKLWVVDEPLAQASFLVNWKPVYVAVEDLIRQIENTNPAPPLPSIAEDVESWFQGRLAEAASAADKVNLCRQELRDPARKTYFRKMAAMNYLARVLGTDAIDDLVPYIGHDYWRLRQHAQMLAVKLAASDGAERLMQRFADADAPTAAGILAVLAASRSSAGLKTAREALQHKSPVVRHAAVQAVYALGGDEVLPQVFSFLRQAQEPADLRGCERALLARRDDPQCAERVRSLALSALSQSAPPARDTLYWILAQLGGADSIDALHQAAATADDTEFREIVNGLSYSPDERAAQTLLSIIQENLGTPRAKIAAREAIRRLVMGPDGICRVSDQEKLDFAEPLLGMVLDPAVVTYLGRIHSGRCAQLLQRVMRQGGVTSSAAESIISATSGMEKATAADRQLAAAALIDAIEYIEVSHLRGGAMANDPKTYAGWKARAAQAGKNLLQLGKPEDAPLPEFDDVDLDL